MRYNHRAMFGTLLRKKQGIYQDPCSGDSGGPLMYRDRASRRWIIIGTVHGGGFDCRTGTKGTFEGTNNGVWNKVEKTSNSRDKLSCLIYFPGFQLLQLDQG
jgi:hypothetical protein